jgi:hypothetical protein
LTVLAVFLLWINRLPNRVFNQCVERYTPRGCGKSRLAVQTSANPHVERPLKRLFRLFPRFGAKFKVKVVIRLDKVFVFGVLYYFLTP